VAYEYVNRSGSNIHQAAAQTIMEPAPKASVLARGRMKISASRFNKVMQCRSRALENRLNL
jgi:hypothetical protein